MLKSRYLAVRSLRLKFDHSLTKDLVAIYHDKIWAARTAVQAEDVQSYVRWLRESLMGVV